MDFMNTYPVKKYLHLADAGSHQRDPSRYVFLWHPDIYRELFETAFLAASEGFLLPDHPIFKDLHQYSYFKAWFIENWTYFAVPLNGLDVKEAGKTIEISFDKTIWSRNEAIEYLQNQTIDDERTKTNPKSFPWHRLPQPDFPLSKTNEQIQQQIDSEGVWKQTHDDDVGFLPVQDHFSRKRMAYMAFKYYEQLVEDERIHKDLPRVYVAHQLGVFKTTRSKKAKDHWSESLEMMLWKQEQKNGEIEKPKFKGHIVDNDWLDHIAGAKTLVNKWRIECIHDFICLSKGVFPATAECLNELGVDWKKTGINSVDNFIRDAEANRAIRDYDVSKYFYDAFDSQLQEFYGTYKTVEADHLHNCLLDPFVHLQISTESPFETIDFSEGHQFSKGWFRFALKKKFCAAKNQIEWFESYYKNIHSLKNEEPSISDETLDYACKLLLNMKPYIESGAWGKTDENGKVADQIHQFEINSSIGFRVAHLLSNTLHE